MTDPLLPAPETRELLAVILDRFGHTEYCRTTDAELDVVLADAEPDYDNPPAPFVKRCAGQCRQADAEALRSALASPQSLTTLPSDAACRAATDEAARQRVDWTGDLHGGEPFRSILAAAYRVDAVRPEALAPPTDARIIGELAIGGLLDAFEFAITDGPKEAYATARNALKAAFVVASPPSGTTLPEDAREAIIAAAVPLETLRAEIAAAPAFYRTLSPSLINAITNATELLRKVARENAVPVVANALGEADHA